MTPSLYSCLSFPGRKSHIFYALLRRNLRPVWFYRTFPHFLINTTGFEKKNHFIFLQIGMKDFSFKKNSIRYYHECTRVFNKVTVILV